MNRILHIIGSMDRAGAETMLINLYRQLDKEKYQFDFLYFTDEVCDFDVEIKQLGGKIYRIPFKKYKNPISRMYILYKLLKREKQFNVIHSHTLLSSGFHLIAAFMAGVKYRIVHSHSTSDIKYNSNIFGKLYKNSAIYIIHKLATHFIACGKESSLFLFPYEKNVYLLPNAINISQYAEKERGNKDYLRKLLKLNCDSLIIIQVGRLDPIKNQIFSIELARYIHDQERKFHLVFVGDGISKNELKQKVKDYQLEDSITFLGLRKDVPELLSGSDVMIMPSIYEGFPVVLIESQSVGIPALISSSIAREVDLGVGLVEFLDLDVDLKNWMDALCDMKMKDKMPQDKRILKIMEKGFDINISIKRVEAIYDSCNF